MRKNQVETRRVKQASSNKRGDRWQPSWPLGWEDDEDWEHIPLQLSFISFSRGKAGDSRQLRGGSVLLGVAVWAFKTEGSILQQSKKKAEHTHTHTCRHTHTYSNFVDAFQVLQKKSKELKMTLGESAEPHWPAQAASQFASPVSPGGWPLLWAAALSSKNSG